MERSRKRKRQVYVLKTRNAETAPPRPTKAGKPYRKDVKKMERLTIDRNKNGFYIVKTGTEKPVYFAGMRQGQPQFVLWSGFVRYFKTAETAQKHADILSR